MDNFIPMTRPLFSDFIVVSVDLHISSLDRHYRDCYGFTEIVVLIFKVKDIAFGTIKFAHFLNFRINTIFLWYIHVYIIL